MNGIRTIKIGILFGNLSVCSGKNGHEHDLDK